MYFPLIDLNDSRIHWVRPHVVLFMQVSTKQYNSLY
uniref:Uncharacterized protein n=1 Tax=Brassica campestris TaxID=3711 RepID=A0A3P5YR18_BRACM|nr:unnamed protein product [Brassica rapa]